MRVAADDRHARLGEPELWRDNVDDALVALAVPVQVGLAGGAVHHVRVPDLASQRPPGHGFG
jgi:hypothetical protein